MDNNTYNENSEESTVIPVSERAEFNELKPSKKRKYDESYLQFGFIPVGSTENPDEQCVICNKILLNSSLVPAKLKRHLETNHPHLKDKEINFFKKRKVEHNASVSVFHKYAKDDGENATEASFILSYNIGRAGKPHTIAESLIKPCMTEVVRCVIGEEAAKKIAIVQCSNNTVSDRIHKISDHIENELTDRLKSCNMFAIQLHESTDVAGLSILLVYVRYIFKTSIEEDLLLCTPLETNATGEEIFKVIDNYMIVHHIDWSKCIDVCSDGAAAMIGKIKGTITRIKNVAPKCNSSHCVLHRHALVGKKMPTDLKQVLNEAVYIVNYVKSRPLQSRIFKKICEEMGSQHNLLLLHTEVRWLSRGKVLTRLFEIRDELKIFLSGHNKPTFSGYFELLHDEQWLIKLAYLADIFSKLNEVSKSLQGKSTTTFMVRDKMTSLKNKLNFWITCVKEKNFECFPLLMEFLMENELQLTINVRKNIIEHLVNLRTSLSEYFPNFNNDIDWIQNPFVNQNKPSMLSVLEYENLIDIQSSTFLKQKFESMSLNEFWIELRIEYQWLIKLS